MKFALILLALIATSAQASVDNMVAQCEEVMRCPMCQAANDGRQYPNGVPLVTKQGKVIRIPQADYDYIRNTGYAKTADGRHLMCARVEQAMKEPESGRGLAARLLFNSDWKRQEYCPKPQGK